MDNISVSIKLATAADLKNVQFCARAAYAKYVERIGQEPAPMVANFAHQIQLNQVYIAVRGAVFAGYVVFYPEQNYMHLENIAIIPDQSGQGIGRMLIEYVEQAARKEGCAAVELYTNEAMIENLSMYAHLGYVETSRKRQAGFSRVFFRKSL